MCPELVPKERYSATTPATANFYERLTSGLALTIDGERQVRLTFEVETATCQTRVAAAQAELGQAEADLSAAEHKLATLPVKSGKRVGVGVVKEAIKDAKERRGSASAELPKLVEARDRAAREVDLRAGTAGTLHRLQSEHTKKPVGSAPFGVYALYDYDGEAMYVGKTTEGVAIRVRRHLSNQRTDAVAMNVLDPLEVAEIEVWPIWVPTAEHDRSNVTKEMRQQASDLVSGLEWVVEQRCVAAEHKVFNEKRILQPEGTPPSLPASVRFDALNEEFRRELGHPDLRIARRAAVSARLASKIVERRLRNVGLRRSLQRQMERLRELADARFTELGGEQAVAVVSRTGNEEAD